MHPVKLISLTLSVAIETMNSHLTVEQRIELVTLQLQVGTSKEACLEYHQRHPNDPKPTTKSCNRWVKRFQLKGNVDTRKPFGQKRTVNVTEKIVQLEELIHSNPGITTRECARRMKISKGAVYKILKQQKFRGFKPRKVHFLQLADEGERLEFCDWFLDRMKFQPTLAHDIIFSDESTFYLTPPKGYRHGLCWAKTNPVHFVEVHRQNDQKLNVWCAIHGSNVIGPVFCPGKFNSSQYLQMLKDNLEPYLGSLDARAQAMVLFQQDGAPIHSAKNVTEWLDTTLPLCWIGRGGPHKWPPRSPDLTPMDFFLWGFLKQAVYENHPTTMNELKANIIRECQNIQEEVLGRVAENTVKRIQLCYNRHGGLLEHVL